MKAEKAIREMTDVEARFAVWRAAAEHGFDVAEAVRHGDGGMTVSLVFTGCRDPQDNREQGSHD